jgi:hypothetical protein
MNIDVAIFILRPPLFYKFNSRDFYNLNYLPLRIR